MVLFFRNGQGFQVADDEINMDLATFREVYLAGGSGVEYAFSSYPSPTSASLKYVHSRGKLNFFSNHVENPMDQIFVFFSDEKSVGVKTMRKCVQ